MLVIESRSKVINNTIFDPKSQFPELLRTYRVLSGFQTLQELADALHDQGLFVDVSELSRWQNGKRFPKDRSLLIFLVRLFINSGAISDIGQANSFSESAGMGFLTLDEEKTLFLHKATHLNFKEIQQVDILTKYYCTFLTQGKRGNFAYYLEIEHELDSILWVLTKGYEFKFYSRLIQMWPYIGIFLWDTGRWQEYEVHSLRILAAAKLLNEPSVAYRVLVEDLAWLYFWKGNFSLCSQTLKSAEKYHTHKISNSFRNLFDLRHGILEMQIGNISVGLEEIKKADRNFMHSNNSRMEVKSALFLGNAFMTLGKHSDALEAYSRSLKLSEKIVSEDKAKVLYYMGELHLLQRKIDEAKCNFHFALKTDQINGRVAGIAWNKLGLAQCETGEKKKTLAIEAVKIFDHLGMRDKREESLKIAHV